MLYLQKRKNWSFAGLLLLIMLFGICGVVFAINNNQPAESQVVNPAENVPIIPIVGTVEKLQELLDESCTRQEVFYRTSSNAMEKSIAVDSAATEQAPAPISGANDLADYSGTNIQVKGVDEADIVKTDGKYIYTLNQNKLNIVKAIPANQMQLVSTINFAQGFNPRDLYVDTKHLIVIGDSYQNTDKPLITENKLRYPNPVYYKSPTCKAIIYDIKNKSNPSINREIEIEGSCLSTRKISSSLYLVANRNTNYYRPGDPIILPTYRDSATSKEFQSLSCDQIYYFPDCIYNSYVIIAAINTDNLEQKVDIKTYLGNGENIYASTSNLYVAVNSSPPVRTLLKDSAFPATGSSEVNTEIYRFALQQAQSTCTGRGTVPGAILNQFSMDEYKGYFRIATTSGNMWSNGDDTSQNHIYVLDMDLQITGKLENIAPGEKIYSTRFMGDRAYMVTFRNVDPFFVIDLKNPQTPKIMGKLKIPGYSDYLHPYDENHIIGFGKDTIAMKGWNGEPQAFYQGLKVAIFDVTNVSQPVEMSRVVIGDRGTDSEILNNHKALLFSKEKKLMAFPVTLAELEQDSQNSISKIPAHGSFTFQGAYIYNIDLDKGLQYKGRISHLNAADYLKAGDYWYDSDKNIKRVLYIGNILYTISPGKIQAHSTADLNTIASIEL
jgi:inhibitor of cysteine peptidase